MSFHRRMHGDDGASLIFALAFLTLFSVLSISLLSLTGVSSRNTSVTRSRVGLLYSADGGIEYGIRSLLTDTANPPCLTVGSAFEQVDPWANHNTVSVQCRTLKGGTTTTTTTTTTGGGSALSIGYAMVLGSSGLSVAGANNAASMLVRGNVNSTGGLSVPASSPLTITGNLEYTRCPPPANVTAAKCSVASAPKITAPTVYVPTATAPAPVALNSNCVIVYPGKYTGGINFPSNNYYLASGTYYFEGTGDLNFSGSTIFGGAPYKGTPDATETQQITGATPCATDADADAASNTYDASKAGSGVTIILGGNAVLRPQSGNTMELYTRVPVSGAPDASNAGLSVWASSSSQTNYKAATDSTVFRTQDARATEVIHGLVYLPDFVPDIREPINAGANGASIFTGGLVAKGLIVSVTGNGNSKDVAAMAGATTTTSTSTSTSTAVRTTLICSTATAASGASTIAEAVVSLDTTPVVQAWRKVTAC